MTNLRMPTLKMKGGGRHLGMGYITTGATTFTHLTVRVTPDDMEFLAAQCEGGDSVNRQLYLIIDEWMQKHHGRRLGYIPKRIRKKQEEDES